MKYQELIDVLLPYAEEEINISVSSEKNRKNPNNLKSRKLITTDQVSFFRGCTDDSDLIVAVKQSYNSESFENIGESELIKP